jgi:hypothetical protein
MSKNDQHNNRMSEDIQVTPTEYFEMVPVTEQNRLLDNKVTYINSNLNDFQRFLFILPYYLNQLKIDNYRDDIKSVENTLEKIATKINERQFLEMDS